MKRGFTLVELLVVIAIIAMLIAILVPSLNRAKELAKRTICAANLNSLCKGMHLYANEFNAELPACRDGSDNVTSVGFHSDDEFRDPAYSQARGWFLLAKKNYASVGLFKCPSDERVSHKDVNLEGYYDFPAGEDMSTYPFSYCMQNTHYGTSHAIYNNRVWSADDNGDLVIIADMNGLLTWENMGTYWRGWRNSVAWADADTAKANSINHARTGQNVLTINGQVKWAQTPLCGINQDNIWYTQNPSFDGGTSIAFFRPFHDEDSTLLP